MSFCARFRSAALIACSGAALLCAQAAQAATFNVTTNADTGAGSLREAITAANANPGADAIVFTFAVPMPPVFLNLSTALPAITDSVTITGPGTGLIVLPSAMGPADFPIFTITGTPTVEIQNLSISNGRGVNGAGITAVGGTLTVRGCFINDNIAAGSGGGIYMSGAGNATLNIIDTQIFNNRAGEAGGGVYFTRIGGVATLNLTNASIERNQIQNKNPGRNGGGIYLAGTGGPHVVTINNSTFADNAIQTAGIGGGLYVEGAGGALTLVNSTLSGNNSGIGSALSFESATVLIRSCTFYSNNCMTDANGSTIRDASSSSFLMRNTIVSGNIAMTALRDLSDGQPVNGNNNLIGIGGALVNGVNGNIVGVTNPRLVPLNNNGGLTRTFALQPGSPAIDAAGNGSPTIDQRGQPRPSDGDNDGAAGFDIGAFETQRYLVTNTNNTGANSLRLALEQNNLAGGGFVKFAIGSQGSTQTIPVTSTALPGISRTVFLDGWSQGGNAYVGPPLIEIDGSAVVSSIGLNVSAGDCVIRGIAVNAFAGVPGNGVGIGFFDQASLRNWVYGCYIGVGLDGTTPRGNGQIGVWLAPAANSNIIGTNSDGVNDAEERNIISGSSQDGLKTGVYIQSNANIIAGNYVGTDVSGMIAIPNNNGIWVASGTSNRIGVDPNSANPASGRNVVSGNLNTGIALTSQGSNNLIAGNYVGLKADGASALPNLVGVSLDNVTLSLVGGQVAAARNVISGNTNQGVLISGGNAVGNVLWGNFIGLNAAGNAAVGNGTSGVHVRVGATFTRIGGNGDLTPDDANRGNVISGNNGRGIFISGTAAQPTAGTRVFGNSIGLSADGLTAIGNRLAGVTISNSKENLIGTVGGRNFIAGQTDSVSGHGVEIFGIDAFSNSVQNNAIGVNTAGQPRPNAANGVLIADGAIGNLTGGAAAGEGNVIANNGLSGVRVLGNLSVSNAILGNSINSNNELGIDLAGDGVTPNAPAGAVRAGPNELQNYPVIDSVSAAGVAMAHLAARASADFRVEFFSSPSADPSGFGEGLTYLGFMLVQTDATGNSPQFSFNFVPNSAQPWITATATELVPGGGGVTTRGIPTPPGTALNTSEFARAVRINSTPTAIPVFANGVEDTDLTITLLANDPDVGQTITFTVATLPTTGNLFQFGTLAPITSPNTAVTDPSGRVVFRPLPNQFGSPYSTFTFLANDGLADSNIALVTVSIAPIADTPSVTDATTFQSLQTTSGLVITRNPADGPEVTNYRITGVSNGQLFLNDGSTPISNGDFITVAQGAAGLKFTPANLFVGMTTFNVQASLNSTPAGLGGGLAVATITVLPRAFTPSVTNATTLEDTQTTSGLVITKSAMNGPEMTHYKITGITNGSLFQNDGVTPIADGSFITVAQGASGLKFTPTANFFGFGNFNAQASISASDAGLGGSAIPAVITVLPVADTPSVTNATTPRNVQSTSGLVISRNPADGAEVTHFKITAITNGTLFQNDGVTPIANGAFITFAQGNAGLKFTPTTNFVGNGNFNVQASLSNSDSGIGGGTATATITVTPTALTPSVTNATTLEDTQTTSGLVILPDPADGGVTTHFQVTGITNGALFQNDGVTPIANGTFITVAQGAAGLKFTPSPNFFGLGQFNVQASTNATPAGLGGAVTLATITVLPVADTPSVTNATTYESQQTTSGLVISRNPADGPEVTHFKITGITNGTLYQNDGVTAIINGQFITFAQGNAGLRFTPAPGLFTGTGNFSVQASISSADSGLGGGLALATITILPVNQPPSFTANDPPAVLEGTGGVVVSGWVTSFNPGRPNEGGQIVAEYLVDQVSNPALFAAFPSVSSSGVLTYATASVGYGTSTFRVRVRDTGGTDHGGNDTSAPQTFTIIVRPAAQCNAVVIDARIVCPPRTVQPDQINKTPSDPGPGATQTVTFSPDLNMTFPIGTTPVQVTVSYSDGLVSSVTCNVTVFAIDCNNNGTPDSCEVSLGSVVDCNNNGIADECECLWDQGLFPDANAMNANGQLSHEGGGAGGGAKAADDFYLNPSHVYRMSTFVGQMLTNTLPMLRKARLEIYESCDGMPVGTPIYVNVKSSIRSTVPAAGGYDLVTYFFNLCDDELWLDGGKSYWVSLVALTDNQGTDTSYWVTTAANPDPTHVLGKPPQKANAPITGGQTYVYGPWETGADCCIGCVNLAWKISGEPCKIAWDNGKPVLSPDPNAGGTPSGADGPGLPWPHTADNFVLNPCATTEVCYLEAYVWTNCVPVHGFAELFTNGCYEPNTFTPLLTADATKAIPTGETITYQNRVLNGYKLIFSMPGWRIPTGGTYWISFGVRGGGSANERSLFAYSDPFGCVNNMCTIRVLPGRIWQPFNNGTEWVSTGREYAFRVGVKVTGDSPSNNPGSGTGAGPICVADVDQNGTVSVDDLFIFMSTWFSGCP